MPRKRRNRSGPESLSFSERSHDLSASKRMGIFGEVGEDGEVGEANRIRPLSLLAVRAVVRTVLAARTPRCIMMFDGARAVLKCFYTEYTIYGLKF